MIHCLVAYCGFGWVEPNAVGKHDRIAIDLPSLDISAHATYKEARQACLDFNCQQKNSGTEEAIARGHLSPWLYRLGGSSGGRFNEHNLLLIQLADTPIGRLIPGDPGIIPARYWAEPGKLSPLMIPREVRDAAVDAVADQILSNAGRSPLFDVSTVTKPADRGSYE